MTCIASFQITIEIEDTNDNTPYFVDDYSSPVNISEGEPEEYNLIEIKAIDNDSSREYKYVA